MKPRHLWLAALAVSLAIIGPAAAQGPAPRDAQALADKIDAMLAQRWVKENVQPVPLADDAEYLRRVYLDLAGRIPTVPEARAFLNDKRPDRRAKLVDSLLASPRYTTHFTDVWRALLIPEASNNFLVRAQQGGFEAWLQQRVKRNAGYDEIARDLLTAPISVQGFGALANGGAPSPLAFYSAKEFKPENLAAGTARVFLGLSVECAQCHHHPFREWKREQFWAFSAFFSGIQSQQVMDFLLPSKEIPDRRELKIPGTDKVMQAVFLDGSEPKWQDKVVTRQTLAEWVTSPDNIYFRRAAANRMWAYFFGHGLVEPLDEFDGEAGKVGHRELVDLLGQELANHKFDTHYLIRAITASRAYQLTSAADKKDHSDPILFARMPVRNLTGEQLFDSVATATGLRNTGGGNNDLLSAITGGNKAPRAEFLTKFATAPEQATKAQSSILQALSLMNGKVIADATSLDNSETLAAIVDAPFLATQDRIVALFLAALSRKPSAKEMDRSVRFVDAAMKNGPASLDEEARRTVYGNAMADIFWVLLNSSEFSLNH